MSLSRPFCSTTFFYTSAWLLYNKYKYPPIAAELTDLTDRLNEVLVEQNGVSSPVSLPQLMESPALVPLLHVRKGPRKPRAMIEVHDHNSIFCQS